TQPQSDRRGTRPPARSRAAQRETASKRHARPRERRIAVPLVLRVALVGSSPGSTGGVPIRLFWAWRASQVPLAIARPCSAGLAAPARFLARPLVPRSYRAAEGRSFDRLGEKPGGLRCGLAVGSH